MTPIEFAEVVDAICKRPRMYTRFGTLAEVVAFLDGSAAALNVGGHLPFTSFLRRLAEKLNHPESFTTWEFLLNLYDSEDKVFAVLPNLYREYAEEVCVAKKD
jgi:hypothetical protein